MTNAKNEEGLIIKKKRRNKGDGCIWQREDGSWVAQVLIGYKADGRPRKKSRVRKNKTEATKALNILQMEKMKGEITLNEDTTFDDYSVRWLTQKKNTLKSKPYIDYKNIRNKVLSPIFGKIRMKKITTKMINDFIQDQLSKGLAKSTVAKYKVLLGNIFRQAISENIVIRNPLLNSTVIKKAKSQTTHIEKEDLETILEGAKAFSSEDYMKKHRCAIQKCLYPVILTAYHTGLRINEVLGLRWKNVFLEDNMIMVEENLTIEENDEGVQKLIVGTPKSDKSFRRIKISKTLSHLLSEIKTDGDIVFQSRVGGYISYSNFSKVWRDLLERQDFKGKYHFHETRHTNATELISSGYNMKAVSNRLGHEDIRTTLNLYAHALPKDDEVIAEFFDKNAQDI